MSNKTNKTNKTNKNKEVDLLAKYEQSEQILLETLASEDEYKNYIDDFSEYEITKLGVKNLYEYQSKALENALIILKIFYTECQANKQEFYELLSNKYKFKNLDIKLEKSSLLKEYFAENIFSNYKNEFIKFAALINQMCFWMATGSGKTIVIIKLIEILKIAMENDFLPTKDIYFFTANDNLLKAFEEEVKIYNQSANNKILLHSLKDYEKIKRHNKNLFGEINVFYYGAYNLREDKKDKQLDFKEVLNNGNNYVILDEAHKGDKSYSKMQHIMNVLSKNGFLFNFSATFNSAQDIAMTVLNLNAAEWIKKGYGKRPLLLKDSELKAFQDKTDTNEVAKQKAILKALIALYICKISKVEVNSIDKNAYHNPMMLVFSNSVTAENSDAHLFFKTIQQIAKNDNEQIFKAAKDELVTELKKSDYLIKTDDDKHNNSLELLSNKVIKLTLNELKEQVFYSKLGNIEAVYYKGNKNEIIFKLDSTEIPFMLIRIGDITEWLKNNLVGVKITESHKNLETFNNIDESSINILLGSRMFSEGWDTTRPNVSLYLNIGVDKEAKTFVMQSLGRTLRIQSYNGDRRRALYANNDNENYNENGNENENENKNESESKKIEPKTALETSFIFATNSSAIQAIIDVTDADKKQNNKNTIKLEKNPAVNDKVLFIPKYKHIERNKEKIKIKLSDQNKELAEIYARNSSNSLMALQYNIFEKNKVSEIKKLCEKNLKDSVNNRHYKNINGLMNEIIKISNQKEKIFDKFTALKDEIIHFQNIRVNENIKNIVEQEIKNKYQESKVIVGLEYKCLTNHYYAPLICESNSKNFSRIISVQSEIDFLAKLNELLNNEDYLQKIENNIEWWFFSKIVDRVDNVYIPYLENAESKKFYPDFIFWIKPKNTAKLKIVFVDPKGTKYDSGSIKCDGYKEIFEKHNNDNKADVKLFLVQRGDDEIPKEYKNYWLDVNSKTDLMKIFE